VKGEKGDVFKCGKKLKNMDQPVGVCPQPPGQRDSDDLDRPDSSDTIRLTDIGQATCPRRSTIYKYIAEGVFPTPCR
jgi:hypothetical protein